MGQRGAAGEAGGRLGGLTMDEDHRAETDEDADTVGHAVVAKPTQVLRS